MKQDDKNFAPEVRITEHVSSKGKVFINFRFLDWEAFREWGDLMAVNNRFGMVIKPRFIQDDRSSHVCYYDEQKHLKK